MNLPVWERGSVTRSILENRNALRVTDPRSEPCLRFMGPTREFVRGILALTEREQRFRRETRNQARDDSPGLDDGSPVPRGEGQGEGKPPLAHQPTQDDSRNGHIPRVLRQSRRHRL